MRTLAQLVTAAAVAVGYIAAWLSIAAGAALHDRDAFLDAPAQVAAFRAALDQRADTTPVSNWFNKHAAPDSAARASISRAYGHATTGDFDGARRDIRDIDTEVMAGQRTLEERSAESWGRALPWLVTDVPLAAAALVFRLRRRTVNAKTVALIRQYALAKRWWLRPVFLLVSGLCWALLLGGTLAIYPIARGGRIDWLAAVLPTLPAGYYGLRYARPRTARSAAAVLRSEDREPVLYLRGFGDDPASAVVDRLPSETWMQSLLTVHTREEQLIGALRAFGPVIAVGRPGERLPRLGAARFYLPEDDWRAGVLELMTVSQLIVLRLGEGPSVWWEVEQAIAMRQPRKLVILLPGGRWDLAARLDKLLCKPSGSKPEPGKWTASVIVFDDDWTPHVQAVGPAPGETNVRGTPAFYVACALQAALARIGVRKRLLYRIGGSALPAYGKFLLFVLAAALVLGIMRTIFPG
ncbi:transferase [Amycolatopsis sp. Hca4]|uniref:transferase n=1 Tax=Amycolatopsis sp. Hca4 TaxID=2742131 RepID=UPI001590E4A5|nr:transferase [Amycolatopsis sp. Hca4]QKV73979.1 transferase [Amycolatopsis sp. Hca4]